MFTIEPDPRNLERMRDACRDLGNVEVASAAVTDSTGTGRLDHCYYRCERCGAESVDKGDLRRCC